MNVFHMTLPFKSFQSQGTNKENVNLKGFVIERDRSFKCFWGILKKKMPANYSIKYVKKLFSLIELSNNYSLILLPNTMLIVGIALFRERVCKNYQIKLTTNSCHPDYTDLLPASFIQFSLSRKKKLFNLFTPSP